MRICKSYAVTAMLVALIVGLSALPSPAADMKPEDVVAKHVDALGTADARAAIKNRLIQGKSKFKLVVGGGGELQGTGAVVSEGHKAVLMFKYVGDYRGEQFITDGSKASFAATTASHHRSTFAEFVRSQDWIVRDGLLGGELTTGWVLLNLDPNVGKVSYGGLKKFDGKQMHDIRFRSKKHDDMDVHIYIDPDTFQHVATVYSISLANGPGGEGVAPLGLGGTPQQGVQTSGDPTMSSKQRDLRYTVEERFSDFKPVDGLTLPTHYNIHFTQELASGSTVIDEWDLAAEQISHNMTLDPKNFEVK